MAKQISTASGNFESETYPNSGATGIQRFRMESLNADSPWGSQGHPSYAGIAWYRRHLKLIPSPNTDGTFRILIPNAEDSYEVYWNGNLIGRYGKLPPHPTWFYVYFPGPFL